MQKILYILITGLCLSACLKKDILDEDLNDPNFQESDFFTSGEFNSQFDFIIESVDLKTIVNPTDPNDIRCEPTYTLRLNDNFVTGLTKEWSNKVVLKLYQDSLTPPRDAVTFEFNDNYGQSIKFEGTDIECNATSSDLEAAIFLFAPSGRATASIERRKIYITF